MPQRVVGRLRHPNVLQVYDFGEEQGYLYLATEYVPGGTFQNVLRRDGKLPPERALTSPTPPDTPAVRQSDTTQ